MEAWPEVSNGGGGAERTCWKYLSQLMYSLSWESCNLLVLMYCQSAWIMAERVCVWMPSRRARRGSSLNCGGCSRDRECNQETSGQGPGHLLLAFQFRALPFPPETGGWSIEMLSSITARAQLSHTRALKRKLGEAPLEGSSPWDKEGHQSCPGRHFSSRCTRQDLVAPALGDKSSACWEMLQDSPDGS